MPRALAVAVLIALPLNGCCSFARFFCGPDHTPWVSVDYSSPETALRTLLEALRRDDADVVYASLSDDYRRRMGIDGLTVQVAWQRFRDANPGLHVAGYATVSEVTRPAADRAAMTIDVEGHRFAVELIRQASWLVRYERQVDGEYGPPGKFGRPLQSFAGQVQIAPTGQLDRSQLTLAPLVVRHDGIDELTLEAIEQVVLERTWRITDLRALTD